MSKHCVDKSKFKDPEKKNSDFKEPETAKCKNVSKKMDWSHLRQGLSDVAFLSGIDLISVSNSYEGNLYKWEEMRQRANF